MTSRIHIDTKEESEDEDFLGLPELFKSFTKHDPNSDEAARLYTDYEIKGMNLKIQSNTRVELFSELQAAGFHQGSKLFNQLFVVFSDGLKLRG